MLEAEAQGLFRRMAGDMLKVPQVFLPQGVLEQVDVVGTGDPGEAPHL